MKSVKYLVKEERQPFQMLTLYSELILDGPPCASDVPPPPLPEVLLQFLTQFASTMRNISLASMLKLVEAWEAILERYANNILPIHLPKCCLQQKYLKSTFNYRSVLDNLLRELIGHKIVLIEVGKELLSRQKATGEGVKTSVMSVNFYRSLEEEMGENLQMLFDSLQEPLRASQISQVRGSRLLEASLESFPRWLKGALTSLLFLLAMNGQERDLSQQQPTEEVAEQEAGFFVDVSQLSPVSIDSLTFCPRMRVAEGLYDPSWAHVPDVCVLYELFRMPGVKDEISGLEAWDHFRVHASVRSLVEVGRKRVLVKTEPKEDSKLAKTDGSDLQPSRRSTRICNAPTSTNIVSEVKSEFAARNIDSHVRCRFNEALCLLQRLGVIETTNPYPKAIRRRMFAWT